MLDLHFTNNKDATKGTTRVVQFSLVLRTNFWIDPTSAQSQHVYCVFAEAYVVLDWVGSNNQMLSAYTIM